MDIPLRGNVGQVVDNALRCPTACPALPTAAWGRAGRYGDHQLERKPHGKSPVLRGGYIRSAQCYID